ncbi:Glu/Leu/Phe/Val family dehydrogenase [Taklimakanibacter deserti]|uniref:Glu/Leu/Phe/Val family dehydrogenase n=1 Tax=Taklimakanibacter deserti TaxID=2267839 RepID=UPI000E65AAD6
MDDLFAHCDALGPYKIVHICRQRPLLKAVVVVDNVARGPAIGGLRMAGDATLPECMRLARAMTLKNAAAGLPHGGAKSVIIGDPHVPLEDKEVLIRAFASAIRDIEEYIAGPDMGTDERCMAWIHDEIGRVIGVPRELGGIPLDEIGATGFGCMIAAEVAGEFARVPLKGARVAIQGFGAVGQHAARFLAERGAILVAASDSKGTIIDERGIDPLKLAHIKQRGGTVLDANVPLKRDRNAIIAADCDIWIPAARPDVLQADNVGQLKAKMVIQGANIPVTAEAERYLNAHAILSVPDFIANAGGVICGAVEYRRGSEREVFELIGTLVAQNTREVLTRARNTKALPRDVAHELANERIAAAMRLRRWS